MTPHIITIAEMIACIEREIRMRERVYPRWIATGKMTQAKADAEIVTMKAVLAFLRPMLPLPPQMGLVL